MFIFYQCIFEEVLGLLSSLYWATSLSFVFRIQFFKSDTYFSDIFYHFKMVSSEDFHFLNNVFQRIGIGHFDEAELIKVLFH